MSAASVNTQKMVSELLGGAPIDPLWAAGSEKEPMAHRIHGYPAKFPAFLTKSALRFAARENHRVASLADPFCGSGTTALEARRNGLAYWGCDINPVAAMIAKVKSGRYNPARLEKALGGIRQNLKQPPAQNYEQANARLKYWFRERQFNALHQLKAAILNQVETDQERLFFLCAFSNILKSTSVWAQGSIKPQVDPNKEPAEVGPAFEKQCANMLSACMNWRETHLAEQQIVTGNFLSGSVQPPPVDMIVTSPPYATSYEYADLHQLSTLWLDVTDDYRKLREGCLGSSTHRFRFAQDGPLLNDTALKTVYSLLDQAPAKARSVAQYLLNMQRVAQKALDMLTPGGMAFFVIGNTAYKRAAIDNAGHFVESLFRAGFAEITAAKREIKGKTLPPNRDSRGRFTKDQTPHPVYKREFVIIGRKAI